jgi:hypothetical protein
LWAAFGACARVRGFAAAAACGEAFGSKRVARRDGFAAAAACGEAFGSKRVAAGASGVDAASAGAVMRQLQPSACCSASILSQCVWLLPGINLRIASTLLFAICCAEML